MDKTPLELQIEQEAKELREAPVITPVMGRVHRCNICGQVFSKEELNPFDMHVPLTQGARPRYACPNCHPERG
jgi:hypothetical protein